MSDAVVDQTERGTFQVWRGVLSGASASLVGIGLARFAYTPLLPAIIGAQWFPASTAAYLGAANLGGYLAGALMAGVFARHARAATVLRAMMVIATLAFVACAIPLSFAWFFAWRFLSGIAGGTLMVLAAPTIIAHVAPSRRGFASGAIFTGIGLGIAASGTIVPLLLRQGLTATWLGLAVVSLLLTVVAWRGWPAQEAPAHGAHVAHVAPRRHAKAARPTALRALFAEYALNAAGLVPHMIFLVDFVARGLGKGVDAGAEFWVLYGIGAIAGPLLAGHLADRAGFGPALRVAYLLQAAAVAIPALTSNTALLMVSSVVVGAFTPGIVPLMLGRVNELLAHHPAEQKGAWRTATTSFAILQALAAYGMSFLFANSGGDYRLLFGIGTGALAMALAIDLFAATRGATR